MATFSKLPSGRYRAQVRKKGVYRAYTFDTKRAAQHWATQIEAQISQVQASGFVRPKGLTIGLVVSMYQEAMLAAGKAQGRTKQACLKRLQERLQQVTPESLPIALRDYVDGRVAEGAGGVTISQDLSYLASALDWARHVRRFDVDPEAARDARRGLKHRKLDTRSVERDRLPTADEIATLEAHWANNPRQQIPMAQLVTFARHSGLRLGEICRIQAQDVDSKERSVLVRQRKDPRNKANNDQRVPLVGAAWDMVEEKLQTQDKGRLFPYNASSVSTAFTRACKQVNIVDLHFHDLRHEATVRLFRMGLDIPRVALITGHKDWKNLKRYTNLTAADVHAALAATNTTGDA